jgi:hypothetical protein
MRDILGYFRETGAEAGDAFSRPIFTRHIMRYYTANEQAVFTPAMEALAAAGLVERHAGTIYLTQRGHEALVRP